MCSNAYANIKRVISFAVDFIFPTICIGCGGECKENFLCSQCLGEIYLLRDFDVCLVCGEPFGEKFPISPRNLCHRCLKGRFSFESARSIAYYRGVFKTFIQKFKYNKQFTYGVLLCSMLDKYFPFCEDDFDIIIPVPLHIKKLRKREFNQSAVLSLHIAKKIGITYAPFVLKKIRETVSQVDLRKEEQRIKNVKGVFAVANTGIIKGAKILLVDDVFTTGATTDECSRVLMNAGAETVKILTLARAYLEL